MKLRHLHAGILRTAELYAAPSRIGVFHWLTMDRANAIRSAFKRHRARISFESRDEIRSAALRHARIRWR